MKENFKQLEHSTENGEGYRKFVKMYILLYKARNELARMTF